MVKVIPNMLPETQNSNQFEQFEMLSNSNFESAELFGQR